MKNYKKTIFDIPNPYDYTRPVINAEEFAGRSNEVDEVERIFDNVKNNISYNLAILGERACGKTSLINYLIEKVKKKNGLPIKIDLNENLIKSDITFFIEIFDKIIEEGINKNLIGGETSEYYKSWRKSIDQLILNEDITKDILRIGRIFVTSTKENHEIPLRDSVIENDLKTIVNNANEIGIDFIAIFIDESDLFHHNKALLQIIRNIIQRLKKVIFVLAGTNKMFDSIDEVFSPIPRQFKKINLKNFTKLTDTIDCIIKPIESQEIKKDIIKEYIDLNTIQKIHTRTGGNPYHIKLISHFMFDEFINSSGEERKLRINNIVLERVFNELYQYSTKRSRSINELLHKCSNDELKEIRSLLEFCNLTVFEAALATNYLRSPDKNTIKAIIESILRTYNKIQHTTIVCIKNSENGTDIIESKYNPEKIREFDNFKICFNGDELDSLFIDYYLQDKLGKFVNVTCNKRYEELILFYILQKVFVEYVALIEKEYGKQKGLLANTILLDKGQEKIQVLNQPIIEVYTKLLNLIETEHDSSEAYKIGIDLGLTDVIDILDPCDFCNIFQISGTIRDSYFAIRIYQPIIINNERETNKIYIEEKKINEWEHKDLILKNEKDNDKLTTDDYQIEITRRESILLSGYIINQFAFMNINAKTQVMIENIIKKEYDKSLKIAKHIYRITKEYSSLNNQGFIEMLINDFNSAENSFNNVLNKNRNSHTTLFNLGYLYYRKGELVKSEQKFRDVERLCKKMNDTERQHIFFKIPLLKHQEANEIRDMDLIMNPDILQVTYCSLAILCSMGNKIPNAKHFFEKAKQISKNALLIKRVESYMEFHFGDYGEAIRISKTILDTLNEQESSEFVSEEQIKLDIEYFQKYNGN